jgi:O-antigen ligase
MHKFLFLLFIFSSFDIVLNLKIGGFSLRGMYIIELFLLIYILFLHIKGSIKTIKILYGKYLILWLLFIIAFIPNTTIIMRSIGYAVWLVLSILLIILLSTSIQNKIQMKKIFDYYIASFKYIAILGLIQFFLGLLGINFFIEQWWIEGVFPRINGFFYEPSYYSSYMLIGWAILFYLYMNYKKLFLEYKMTFLLITSSIILSSSRMAILMIVLMIVSLIFISFSKRIVRFRISKRDLKFLTFFLSTLSIIIFYFFLYFEKVKFLIAGLGILGASSHSSSTRTHDLLDTLQVFFNSPFIGTSLGGVAPAIANIRGVKIYTQVEAKEFEGMNIFIEVLAASGIVGYIFFLLFFFSLFYKANNISNKIKTLSIESSMIIKSLKFALFWELLILSMNQNILRPYLWILIGMLSASILIAKGNISEKKTNNRL